MEKKQSKWFDSILNEVRVRRNREQIIVNRIIRRINWQGYNNWRMD